MATACTFIERSSEETGKTEEQNAYQVLMDWLEDKQNMSIQWISSEQQCSNLKNGVLPTLGNILLLDGQSNPSDFLDYVEDLKNYALVIILPSHIHLNTETLHIWRKLGANHLATYTPKSPNTYSHIFNTIELAAQNHKQLNRADAIAQQMQELHQSIEQRNQQVEKELYLARQLQQSLLPTPLDDASPADELTFQFSKLHYQSDTLRISGLYVPCDALGGDLYDLIHFKNDRSLSVIMADVSGHGITAGFITAIFKALYHQSAYDNPMPNSVLTHINDELAAIIKTGDYITSVAYHIQRNLEEAGHTIHYSGAGHPFPYLYQANEQKTIRLDKNSMPLGWFGGTEYPVGTITLNPGDKLLLFTDGITELKNDQDELFGEERLDELFTKMAKEHQGPFLDFLLQDLSDFTNGQALDDDLSMLLIEGL